MSEKDNQTPSTDTSVVQPGTSAVQPGKPRRPLALFVITAAAIGFVAHLGILHLSRFETIYHSPDNIEVIKSHPLKEAGLGGYVLMAESALSGQYGIQQIGAAVLAGQASFGFVVPVGDKVGWIFAGITVLVSFVLVIGLWTRQAWAHKVFGDLIGLSAVALLLDALTRLLPNPLPELSPWAVSVRDGSAYTGDHTFMCGLILLGCLITLAALLAKTFKIYIKG